MVTAAVYWAFHSMRNRYSRCNILLVSFQHRAGIRPYTSFFKLAESCVFSKQSSPPIHCVLFSINKEEPFIPKLQGEFAEFLQSSYLIRLCLLNILTCVGFRYGLLLLYTFPGTSLFFFFIR